MFKRLFYFSLLAAVTLVTQPSLAQTKAPADEVVTLDTRPGVKQSFLLLKPRGELKGVVLMFPGHEGVVEFVKGTDGYEVTHDGGGLTVRETTRETFRSNGLVVALVAPPSDMQDGMGTEFRSSDEHLEDIRHVMTYLENKYHRKIFLHGHCRSTFSPASITTHLKNEGIAGMILSSPRSTGKHGSVMDYEQGVISVPVLLVQHKDDPCNGTPYSNLNRVKEFYAQSSKKVDVIVVTGGNMEKTGPGSCNAGPHAFRGLEKETASAIANWILGKEFARNIDGAIQK
jgi:hypothetical protein